MTDQRSRLERAYRVRFDESGPDGLLPASGVLRYVQDLAWLHSNEEGFGRDWYAERGLTWLIRAIELEMLAPVAYGRTVNLSTEVVGFRRVWARRRSQLTSTDMRQPLAMATIDWVLLDASGTPTRVPQEIADAFKTSVAPFAPLRVRLPRAPGQASVLELAVRRSELDPLAHVNNAAYFDYIDEHLAAASRENYLRDLPRRYAVEFVAPAEPGMSLRATGWEDDRAWSWRLESGAGRELVRATVETLPRQPKIRS